MSATLFRPSGASGASGRSGLSGLAAVEARAPIPFRAPVARNRGTTWAYPGFGRDPELQPVGTAPAGPAPVPLAPPVAPPVVAPTPVAPAEGSNGGNQNQGGLTAQNPGGIPNVAAGDAPDIGGRGWGVGGGDGSGAAGALADINSAIGAGVGPESAAWSSPVAPDPLTELNAMIALGYGPESVGWGSPGMSEAQAMMGGFQSPSAGTGSYGYGTSPTAGGSGDFGAMSAAQRGEAVGAPGADNPYGQGGQPSDTGPGPGQPGGPGAHSGTPDGVGEGWGDNAGSPGHGGGGGSGHSGGGDGQGGAGGDAGGDGQGWMVGGYTGAGDDGVVDPTEPVDEPVHEGEVVIPAHQVAQHGLDPLMQLAGPGAKMGTMPALGMVRATGRGGPGEPPVGNFAVPSFQTPSHGNGASPPPHQAGSPMAPTSEADAGGMDMDEPFDMAQPSDDFMHGMGPHSQDASYGDPFKQADPSQGSTGASAMSAIGQLSPDGQAAVLQALGGDPMTASALLQVLGPSYRDLIAKALRSNAPPPQPMAGAGGMMGSAPGMIG